MGSVDVVTTGNQHGQLEGAIVGLDEKFSTGLGGGVRVGGLENVLLRHGTSVEIFSLSVNFISGHMNESTHGGTGLGRFEKDVSSVDIGVRKGK